MWTAHESFKDFISDEMHRKADMDKGGADRCDEGAECLDSLLMAKLTIPFTDRIYVELGDVRAVVFECRSDGADVTLVLDEFLRHGEVYYTEVW